MLQSLPSPCAAGRGWPERSAGRVRGNREGRLAFIRVQLRQDCNEDTIYVAQYMVVPETQNPVAFRREIVIANAVPDVVCVLASIDLDYQLSIAADKINDVPTDRLLPGKFEA